MLLEQLKKYGTFVLKDESTNYSWIVTLNGRELSVSYGNLGNPYLCSQQQIGISRFKNDNDILHYLQKNKDIFNDEMTKYANYHLYVAA